MRYLLARLTAFRAWVGATTGDEAAKLAAALLKTNAQIAKTDSVTPPFAVSEYGTEKWDRQGMGGGVSISYNIDARGADPGSEMRMQRALRENAARVKADILASMNGGGTFARASGRA
jgi:hypothetical protein